MKDLKESEELVQLVDCIESLLTKEELERFEQDYNQSLDYAVKNGYPTVIIKKYLEDFIFKKITNTLRWN